MGTDYDKSNEVLNLLKESWTDFKKYYRAEKERYSKDGCEGHVVCWKEDDIVLQLSRFFYNKLGTSLLKNEKGIEFHSQIRITQGNFKENQYDFNKNISNLKGHPRPDFIITKEDEGNSSKVNGSLWLIGEVKYFREFRSNWQDENDEDKRDRVQKDIDKLNALKENRICKKTVYLLADDYFHRQKNKDEWNKIQSTLKKAEKIDYLNLITMCSKENCPDCNGFDFEKLL